MADGGYGCCPLPNAICCSDNNHCCPKNTKCDIEQGTCITEDQFGIDWFKKEQATKFLSNSDELTIAMDPLTCPDGTTCDARSTCCKMEKDSYGCCPYSNGVCCEGSSFCCPPNNKCGNKPGECLPQRVMKVPYVNWNRIEVSARVIQEMNSKRETKNTCAEASKCSKPDGGFGCCPYTNGTCCGVHGWCW